MIVVKNGEYDVPEKLSYTKDHEWLKKENGKCRMGVTDYAQKSLHEVVFVDLPVRGKHISKKEALGTVESVKAVSDYFAPVSGELVEVNDQLSNKPDMINTSPYTDGWIAVIEPSNWDAEIKELMNAVQYSEFLKSISKK